VPSWPEVRPESLPPPCARLSSMKAATAPLEDAAVADALRNLLGLTEIAEVQEARAAGVPENLSEHLPQIVEHVVHGAHGGDIAEILGKAETSAAWRFFPSGTVKGARVTDDAAEAVDAYMRQTYGQEQGLIYGGASTRWTYLIVYLREIVKEGSQQVQANPSLIRYLLQQVAAAQQISALLEGQPKAA
jgi:hypothetical protein